MCCAVAIIHANFLARIYRPERLVHPDGVVSHTAIRMRVRPANRFIDAIVMGNDLLANLLDEPRWHIARRTYGSSHNTLIGLIVDWWISQGIVHGRQHRVMEGALPYEGNKGRCDAILLDGDIAIGVVEVEGGFKFDNYFKKLDTIGHYFGGKAKEWDSLQFGVLLAYPTSLRGELPLDKFVEKGRTSLLGHPERQLIILTLDKQWGAESLGLLFKGRYYHEGRPYKVTGVRIQMQDGEQIIEQRSRILTDEIPTLPA